ncbi:glucokinase regulator family protein, putative [Beauveria bassiana ARSEF 2860]|uniref:N-acetyl-D-glucosamine kinase n=1 Tax=Beauveria bassiana (strain ARSEF 2860) TaxID=655819 RepID=J5J586_BEAB2|nr:glucokinase regulator family protein, putative [Beauveria bassiana ARSEF 2860]EJP61753.1 glucokinase regulator family protein, putative [Beauveria bassiana ARSEF 2860]
MPPSGVDLGGLQTENSNPRTATIDKVSTEELCRILHEEDCRVPAAVTPCLPEIAATIDALTERVRKGGRVFYIGAGTSGRLGVLDASEIPPTYSSPPNQFIALIAGGDYALRNAKEGAEDDRSAAKTDLDAFNIAPNLDSLIGIASSGRTPYVLGGLEYARSIGCTTVGVVCVQPSAMAIEGNTDYLISAVTGSESVTGSTRMKAGTATKLVLNMISTGIMIKLGKTYGNLASLRMVDLKATNIKLRQRARNILRVIGGQRCHHSDQELDAILATARGSTRLAAVMMVLDVPLVEAELRLDRNNGVLDRVFTEAETQSRGTSCKATILSKDGAVGAGFGGPCNVIAGAIQQATDSCPTTKGRVFSSIKFAAARIGLAGYDRPAVQSSVNDGLSKLLNLKIGAGLEVTTDIDLLPVASASEETVECAVVLVAGTGSIAMSFRKENGAFVRSGRAGGWGHLLGDDGSGYSIGREALRMALRESDVCSMRKQASAPAQPTSQLAKAVFGHFKEKFPEAKPEDLLSTVMMPNSAPQQPRDAVMDRTSRIAGVAKTVLAMVKTNEDADRIVAAGAEKLAELAALLVLNQGIKPSKASLVLAGGLMQDEGYRRRIVGSVERAGYKFQHVEVVDQPAMNGARFLLRSAQTLQ